MIYAKCIRETQIAKNREEFIRRQNEENPVYCIGEITRSKVGMDTLYSVPLNFILDCLKYGMFIAIIENTEKASVTGYPYAGSYLDYQCCSTEQRVLDIMKVDDITTIDYILEEVKDPKLIHDGYWHWLSDDVGRYLRNKLNKEIYGK